MFRSVHSLPAMILKYSLSRVVAHGATAFRTDIAMHLCRFVLACGKVTRLHRDVVLVAKWAKILALVHTVPEPAPLLHFVLWTGGMIFFKVLKGHVGKLYVVQLLAIRDERFSEELGLLWNWIN